MNRGGKIPYLLRHDYLNKFHFHCLFVPIQLLLLSAAKKDMIFDLCSSIMVLVSKRASIRTNNFKGINSEVNRLSLGSK